MTEESSEKLKITTLSPKKRAFILDVMNGASTREAYRNNIASKPDVSDATCSANGSKLLAKIKSSLEWQEILALKGLDDMRLASELDSRLKAMKTEFFKGIAVAECEDNATRMRATELLADLLGRKKAEITLPTGGGVLLVSGTAKDQSEWEKAAAEQQGKAHEGADQA